MSIDESDLTSVHVLGADNLRWIGIASVEWTFVEESIGLVMLKMLARLPAVERHALIAHIDIKDRMDMIRSIVHERKSDPVIDAEWKSIAGRIDKLRKKRNVIIHFKLGWPTLEDTNLQPVRIEARGELKTVPLAAEIDDIQRFVADVLELRERIRAAWDTSDQP